MFVPRAVQLRTHHQLHARPLPPLPARRLAPPMASPAVDQLVAEYLRKRGLSKALKAFVAEASYKEPKVALTVDLGTICAQYFANKKEAAGKVLSDGILTNGSVPKRVAKPKAESSSDESDEEVKVVAPVSKKPAPESSSSDDSSSDEEEQEVKPVKVGVKANGVEKKKAASSSSSSDSDDEEEVAATTSKAKVAAASKKEESSSSESSDDESEDEKVAAKSPPPASAKGKKPVAATPKPTSSSSSASSSDDEEVVVNHSKVKATAPTKAADDSSSEEDSNVEMRSVTPAVTDKKAGKPSSSSSSDTCESSDDEMEVDTKPATTLKGAPKKSLVTKVKQATPEPTVEKSKVKKGKKSSQGSAPQTEVAAPPVSKKRKAGDEGADVVHVSKKANVDSVAVATARDNDSSKSAQKRKQESATKTPSAARAFQRVRVEEVELLDERLADNSYWAKSGAEEGWGAKAQEILGQVRGKGFRHEKTKKKRGSYKGGIIDNASHSIKFQNSDDE